MDAFFKSHCTSVTARAYCPQLFPDEERAALTLLRVVDSRIEDGKILHVRARGADREIAAQLAADLGRALVRMGADHAKADAARIEQQLGAKRTEIEARIRTAMQTLSKAGIKSGPTLYSPEKQFAFLSDLQAKAF